MGAGALYLWGVVPRRTGCTPGTPGPVAHRRLPGRPGRHGGLAVESFIGVYDRILFWDHMVQHLMLIMVAAALFAVGSPLALAFRAHHRLRPPAVTRGLRSPAARFFGHPAVAFVLYAVAVPIFHLTSFYNYTLEHAWVNDLEHLVFLLVGYLFWRQIFGVDPNRYRLHPALQFAYLFLAIPVDTFTGLSLDSTYHELFPAYLAMHRTWGPSLVNDLHTGGVIMWVGGDTLMLIPMVPVALRWLHIDERRAVRVDRELDLVLPQDRSLNLWVPRAGGTAPDGPQAEVSGLADEE